MYVAYYSASNPARTQVKLEQQRLTAASQPACCNDSILIHRESQMPLFKRDPAKKLKKAYAQKQEAAMHAMRNGDIRQNAKLVAEAEKLKEEIELHERS
jgi:hypothetical protein